MTRALRCLSGGCSTSLRTHGGNSHASSAMSVDSPPSSSLPAAVPLNSPSSSRLAASGRAWGKVLVIEGVEEAGESAQRELEESMLMNPQGGGQLLGVWPG